MTLQIGDVFYKVNKQHNGIPRKKESIVIDGKKWFAYEKPVYKISISMITIIGILEKKLTGEWESDSSYDFITEYYVKDTSVGSEKKYITDFEFIAEDKSTFKTIDEALEYADNLKKEVEELDH